MPKLTVPWAIRWRPIIQRGDRHADLPHRLGDGPAPTQLDFDLSELRDNGLWLLRLSL
jgi:hypothetical protein